MSLGGAGLPLRAPLRGLPGFNQDASLDGAFGGAQGLDPSQQPTIDDVQKFVNSGGLQQLLQDDPSKAARLQQMLQQVAANASRDAQQLQSLGQQLGVGNADGAGTATGQAFNPTQANALPLQQPSRIGSLADGSGIDSQLATLGQLGGGGGFFEDRVFAIMCKVVSDFQKQIEQRLQSLQDQAQQAQGQSQNGGQDSGAESRNIEFEKIKYDMQKLSQMQQAMSNVLDSMNDLAQNAIRKIKGQ